MKRIKLKIGLFVAIISVLLLSNIYILSLHEVVIYEDLNYRTAHAERLEICTEITTYYSNFMRQEWEGWCYYEGNSESCGSTRRCVYSEYSPDSCNRIECKPPAYPECP